MLKKYKAAAKKQDVEVMNSTYRQLNLDEKSIAKNYNKIAKKEYEKERKTMNGTPSREFDHIVIYHFRHIYLQTLITNPQSWKSKLLVLIIVKKSQNNAKIRRKQFL